MFSNNAYASSTQKLGGSVTTPNSSVQNFISKNNLKPLKSQTITVSSANNNQKKSVDNSFNLSNFQSITQTLDKQSSLKTKNINSFNKNSISPRDNVQLSTVTIYSGLFSNSKDRTIISLVAISSIIGTPPVSLAAVQEENYSDSNQESYKNYHNNTNDWLKVSWKGAEIKVGAAAIQTIPASTHWWGYFGGAVANFVNTDGTTSSPTTYWAQGGVNGALVNRTGHAFPDYTDTWSGKKASDGLRTDWVKIPKDQKDQQTPWVTSIINQKRTEYENTYIHHAFDWKGNDYQLHHMRPRAFSGTNDISNLLAIPHSKHTAITGWFAGYDDPNNSAIDNDPTDD